MSSPFKTYTVDYCLKTTTLLNSKHLRVSMKLKFIIIIFLLFVVFLLRVFFIVPIEGFSDDQTYDFLRQIEQIQQDGLFDRYDELSYEGRNIISNPSLPFLFALILPMQNHINWLQTYIQLIWFLTSISIYLLTKELFKKDSYAILSVVFYTILPIQFLFTLNTFSVYSVYVLILLIQMYIFILWRKQKTDTYFWLFTILSTIFVLIHPIGLLLVFSYMLFLLFLKLDNNLIQNREKEFLFFYVLVGITINYVLYYQAFLIQRSELFFQNYFLQANIFTSFDSILQLGLLVFVVGSYGFYQVFSQNNIQKSISYFILSSVIIFGTLSILQFISLLGGLLIILIISSIFTSAFIYQTKQNLDKLRFPNTSKVFYICSICIILFLLSISSLQYVPHIIDSSPQKNTLHAYEFVAKLPDGLIIVPPEIAQQTMYYTQKKTVVDMNILAVSDVQQRLELIEKIYSAFFFSQIKNQLTYAKIESENIYLFVTPEITSQYTDLLRFTDSQCVQKKYDVQDIQIYKLGCEIDE